MRQYLKDRLKLDISHEKSKIINIRKGKSEFLGYTLYAIKKSDKWVCNSNIRKKKKLEIKTKAKDLIIKIQKSPTAQNVLLYNSFILGIHNYFKYVTNVNLDMQRIAYDLSMTLYNRFKNIGVREIPINAPPSYEKFYKNNYTTYKICGIYLYPLADIRTKVAKSFSNKRSFYSKDGRESIHKYLAPEVSYEIQRLLISNIPNGTVEYLDNRISRYSMKMGKCEITNEFIYAHEVHCHHFKPKKLGGTDAYKNLRIIKKDVHKLIHATNKETIIKYLRELKLDSEQMKKVNQYRKACNLLEVS
ncbi:HNH endonuclease signature motif containing protein [Evansella tamaricis]|uniref:HNH nuclease domain-containing protein n=1 Tax=Evansella tamaricis TaxID=2069301 RepID=A0ABS6JHJ6_9BACI|nr:HNH endonuclease signature motif containing protein [Evansella tamaricis]MBU9711950.1 hypothetical protein [Evansella tamaricis]